MKSKNTRIPPCVFYGLDGSRTRVCNVSKNPVFSRNLEFTHFTRRNIFPIMWQFFHISPHFSELCNTKCNTNFFAILPIQSVLSVGLCGKMQSCDGIYYLVYSIGSFKTPRKQALCNIIRF